MRILPSIYSEIDANVNRNFSVLLIQKIHLTEYNECNANYVYPQFHVYGLWIIIYVDDELYRIAERFLVFVYMPENIFTRLVHKL